MSETQSDYERLVADSQSAINDDLENQQKYLGAEQVWSSQDNHRPKFTRKHLMVALSILTTELCERLTYYSIVANMVLFCTTTLNFTSLEASTVTLVFGGKYKNTSIYVTFHIKIALIGDRFSCSTYSKILNYKWLTTTVIVNQIAYHTRFILHVDVYLVNPVTYSFSTYFF